MLTAPSPPPPLRPTRVFVSHEHATLSLNRYAPAGAARAVVGLVPGYGMNSHILGYHPEGPSLVECLVSSGLEVWTLDLRGQGDSRASAPGTPNHGIAELALEDLAACVAHMHAACNRPIALVGCSLGAALVMTYLAHHPAAPVDRIATLAGLVTWREVHPLVRAMAAAPALAGSLRLTRTRALAGAILPALTRFAPKLLSPYLNAQSTDLTQYRGMLATVEDPSPRLNGELAAWVQARELTVRGINISAALARIVLPYLCVVASQDGIVPPATARAVYEEIGSNDKQLLEVGSSAQPIAHGDLFVGRGMQEAVFQPLARFLGAASSS